MARPVRAGCCSTRSVPGLEVATIVRAHGAAVRQQQALSREQRHALRSIAVCRTPALGGHVDVCSQCGFERPAYHSCRNRHCPKCQSLAQARWIEQRMARALDVDYFHVVFTLPAALRPLALAHRRPVFALLLRAAAQTLLTLGHDPKRLGAELGITAVLHTWTRALEFHPPRFSVTSSCTRCRSRRRPPTSSNCASSIPSHLPLALVERRIALPAPVEHPEPPASVCRNAMRTTTPRGSAQPRFAAASRVTAATSAVTDCALGAANRLLVT